MLFIPHSLSTFAMQPLYKSKRSQMKLKGMPRHSEERAVERQRRESLKSGMFDTCTLVSLFFSVFGAWLMNSHAKFFFPVYLFGALGEQVYMSVAYF